MAQTSYCVAVFYSEVFFCYNSARAVSLAFIYLDS
jgi:hypothetical protein